MDISVVIPVYGCRAALPELHKRLTNSLCKITNDYEIIFVNDACPQNSWETIEEICKTDSKVIGIELSRNFGQIKAITAGLDQSSGEWVVVMDCDLQDQPEDIIRLFLKAQEGYDVVFARRDQRRDSWLNGLLSNCFYKMYSIAVDIKYDPALCNFSICHRKVIDSYCNMREVHRAFVMYIQWVGFKQTSITVDHKDRFEGKSGYDFKKRMRLAAEILTSQSDRLLRIMTTTGFFISTLAFVYMIITIVRHFTMKITIGYSSTIALILLIGGMIISSIGLVGIYVGNIFMEVKHRPLYITRTILNKKEKQDER